VVAGDHRKPQRVRQALAVDFGRVTFGRGVGRRGTRGCFAKPRRLGNRLYVDSA
jgi:hypothetical protein